ncbi:MAG: type II secretion system F family protein [Patescibacteria group bacterium]
MSIFKYKAKNQNGEDRPGTVEASNAELAIELLQRNGLIVVSISKENDPSFLGKKLSLFRAVKTADLILFTRQLSTLFSAKMPVVQSLRTLASGSSNQSFGIIIAEMADKVGAGSSLSQALAERGDVFSLFYINLVKSGEESGKLEESFDFLAGYLERTDYLASKAKNALIYPAFIIATFFLVLIALFIYVVPNLTAILKETGQELPWYTTVVIVISEILVNYGAYVFVVCIAGVFFLMRFLRTKIGRELLDQFLLMIPIIGGLYQKIYLSRIADNLSTLFSGGIPILNALRITADVVDNSVYKKIILDAMESVRGGSTISASFANFRDVPVLVTQMIKIGEETGRLDFILQKLAYYYRQEVDNLLSNLVSLIEPVMIVVLGIAVAFVVAAVFVPLYSLTSSIG